MNKEKLSASLAGDVSLGGGNFRFIVLVSGPCALLAKAFGGRQRIATVDISGSSPGRGA